MTAIPRHMICTDGTEKMTIYPGSYHATNGDIVYHTVLGSCVSVCMFDEKNHVVGMNHFLLSSKNCGMPSDVTHSDAGRYGVHAMELLINAMLVNGAERKNLKVKAFGGASIIKGDMTNFSCIGETNVAFVLEFLKLEGIPVVGSDFGGDDARVVYFCSKDFSVYMKRLGMQKSKLEILEIEKKYWQRTIQKIEKEKTQINIWGKLPEK